MASDTLAAAPGLSAGDLDADDAGSRVQEIVQQLRGDFKQRDELYHRIDQVVFGEIKPHIPKNFRKTATPVQSPLAAHITNTVTAAMTVNHPAHQRRPIGFGDRFVEDATRLEHFMDAAWQQQEEDADRELFRLFMASLCAKGEAVFKTLPRANRAWSGYGVFQANLAADLAQRTTSQRERDQAYDQKTEEWKRARGTYPIGTTDVEPETFYYLPGEEGPTFFAEVTRVPYVEALARHLDADGRRRFGIDREGKVVPAAMGLPRADWGDAMRGNQYLSCTEAYDWRYRYVFLLGPGQYRKTSNRYGSGQLVSRTPHNFGRPDTKTLIGPYAHALGVTTASRLPHRAGLGIITPFLDLFPLLDALLTQYGNGAFLTGWTAYKTNRPAASEPRLPESSFGNDQLANRRQRARVLEPGGVWPDDISALEHPAMGSAFKEFLGIVRGLLDLALPAVVQGAVDGDPSGYALNQAARLARLAWNPIVRNAERALSKRSAFEAYCLEHNVGERVYAWGAQQGRGRKQRGERGTYLSIDPTEDFGGVHKFKVALDPDLPADRMMELRAHQTMLELRLETPEMAVEAVGNSPDEVEKGWLLHDFKQDPEVKGMVVQRAKQLLGILRQRQEQEALASQQALDAAVMGPNGGIPPGQTTVQPGMEAVGAVPQPGDGMPLTPPAPASATSVGANQLRGSLGNVPGAPGGLPAGHVPLPGEG